jgi:AcrR family transcriptional regulator
LQREEKSERSRRQVLDAALDLFSQQGYRATSVRDIAEKAEVSTGNLYHHFPDKEAIFNGLLNEFWAETGTARFPFRRVMMSTEFPDNLEQLGFAARDSVMQYRRYVALIYVDVIEFEGTHIRKFYGDITHKLAEVLEQTEASDRVRQRLRPGVDPISAIMLATRTFFDYFTIQILFRVPEPFGKDSGQTIKEIADIIRNGIVAC